MTHALSVSNVSYLLLAFGSFVTSLAIFLLGLAWFSRLQPDPVPASPVGSEGAGLARLLGASLLVAGIGSLVLGVAFHVGPRSVQSDVSPQWKPKQRRLW